jgi:hypothetical protein
MSSFGKGAKRAADGAGAAAAEPEPKLAKRGGMVPLEALDHDLFEVGAVKDGQQGDKFCPVSYCEGRVQIALNAHPSHARVPFDAGPPKDKKGNVLPGSQWGLVVELTPDKYDAMVKVEDSILKKVVPMRDALLPNEAKKAKGKSLSEDSFYEKFNTKLSPINPDKGYSANIRLVVETDPTKMMPKIQLMHKLPDGRYTRPRPGKVSDLVKGSAVVVGMALYRGFYGGQTGLGCGMKWIATSIDIIVNLRAESGPALDYSGIEFADEDTPEGDGATDATSEGAGEGGAEGEGGGDQFAGQDHEQAVVPVPGVPGLE